jgi:isocitrate lyase
MNTTCECRSVESLRDSWRYDRRWIGVKRPYSVDDVVRLRGTVRIEYTMARLMAVKLW